METRNMKTLIWLPAAVAAGYVLFATYPHGVGITSDSIHYFTSAHHLLEAGTLSTYTGEPLVSYAPLLSVVYALLGLVGIDVQLSARLVGALSFAMVVYIGWRWLEEMQISARFLWIGILLVLMARPLLWYAPYALSELPFIGLTMGALWNAWRYVHNGRRAHLFASIVMAGLSALTRWIGVTTVLSVGLFFAHGAQGDMERASYAGSRIYDAGAGPLFAVDAAQPLVDGHILRNTRTIGLPDTANDV